MCTNYITNFLYNLNEHPELVKAKLRQKNDVKHKKITTKQKKSMKRKLKYCMVTVGSYFYLYIKYRKTFLIFLI